MAFTSFSKAAGEHGRWYLLAEAERWSPLKRKQNKKNYKCIVVLARQSRMMALTNIHCQRISQKTLVPQTNTLKLRN